MTSNNTLKVTKKTIADLSFHAGLLKTKVTSISTVCYDNKDLLRNQPVRCLYYFLFYISIFLKHYKELIYINFTSFVVSLVN